MTSVKRMLRLLGRIGSTLAVLTAAGCGQPLRTPTSLHAPYHEQKLWAVAPFANESGVSHVDAARVADLFTYEVAQTRGLQTVPVNRVISAMRAMEMESIESPADAIALLNVLEVDGLVVGTVTAYDAYDPLQVGMAVQLLTRDQLAARREIDPHAAVRSPVGEGPPLESGAVILSEASGLFDASNHTTRKALADYARGRSIPDSAYGERLYDVSIELYTRFVSHRLLSELLRSERARLTTMAKAETFR